MLRAALVAVGFALATSPAHAGEPRYISIGTDALGTVAATASQIDVLAADRDIAVLEVDDDDLEDIARAMHEQHGRCGGFIVHDSLGDAHLALLRDPAKPVRPPLDYTLDRSEAVHAVLATLDRSALLGTIRELSAMPNRYYKSASGAAASTWLRDRWRSFSDRTDITIELVDHGYPQMSVVLTIPGTSSIRSRSVAAASMHRALTMTRQGSRP
jgi:bacterial leucyl aminopeptidase